MNKRTLLLWCFFAGVLFLVFNHRTHGETGSESNRTVSNALSFQDQNTNSRPISHREQAFVLERLVPTKMLTNIPLLRAVMCVPRERFIHKEYEADAYADFPIPLGSGQVLVSGFETAYALEKLNLCPTDRVWIIGPGGAYAAAIAGQMACDATVSETLPSLLKRSNEVLKSLGIENVRTKSMTPEQIKRETELFDKILVTVSFPDEIPPWLTDRLNEGGNLIAPIGGPDSQRFCLITKTAGNLTSTPLISVCPVPPLIPANLDFPEEMQTSFFEESFEHTETGRDTFIPGWFCLRNASIHLDTTAPDGQSVLWLDSQSVRTAQRRKDALRRKELAKEGDNVDTETELPDLQISPLTLRQRKEERTTLAIHSFHLNGKKSHKIDFSCHMEGVGLVSESKSGRSVVTVWLILFDENRVPLREIPLIALKTGNTAWQEYRVESIPVPPKTRQAEIRIGLSGGYGILKIDVVTLKW